MSSQAEVAKTFRADLLNSEIRAQFITSEELAAKAGVSTKTIDRWRKGESEPRLKSVRSLAAVLGLKPSAFYETTEEATA